VAIERLPAVRDMLIDMKIAIEAGRALLYDASRVVDLAIGYNNQLDNPWRGRPALASLGAAGAEEQGQDALATSPAQDKDELKKLKDSARIYKRYAGMLTPMSKYYCSEMCNRVTYDSMQVLGGSGYMRDYAIERHVRDARITTIYEGTSQLQIVAAVRGVCSGTAERYFAELAGLPYNSDVADLLQKLAEGTKQLNAAIEFTKEQGNDYMDLYGRALVDVAIDLINGYLLCGQASTNVDMSVAVAGNDARNGQKIPMKQRKATLARRYVEKNAPKIKALTDLVRRGDKSTFSEYEALVGPVPES